MKVLILGGTTEAIELVHRCETINGIELITSLAGRTSNPTPIKNTLLRVGGFGGSAGLATFLRENQIDALIDATHPFAAQISFNAAAAAKECNVSHLMLVRPEWKALKGDRWIEVDTMEEAANQIPAVGERIFLTIGRQELSSFSHKRENWFLMRMIEPPTPDIKMPPGELLLEKGPFSLDHELELINNYKIQGIITKNSGGSATEAKILAARTLGLPIIMVKRPNYPDCAQVEDVKSVMLWLKQLNNNRF